MTDPDESGTRGGLSFERAQFDQQQPPALSCAYCQKPLSIEYWQIARRPACQACRSLVERELAASKSRARFIGALQYGLLAALAGSVGWVAVSKITGYQIGIVAIGVGLLVGKAVRKGAGGFGGRRYQILAVFLTYSAIALANLPAILQTLRESQAVHAAASAARASSPGFGSMLWAWATLIAFAYATPFLGGAQGIMGLIIIGIGLYEAWKLTRAVPLVVLGPFPIIESPSAEPEQAPDATH